MNYTWRKITSDDLDILDTWDSENIRKFVTFDNEFVISEYYEMFGDRSYSTSGVALDDNGNIIGALLYDYDSSIIRGATHFNVQLLVVSPELTSKGHGTKMLEDVIQANKENVDAFRVFVEPDNIAAAKMCQKLGFKICRKKRKIEPFDIYELNTRELNKIKNK